MRPGPTIVIACPHCAALAKYQTIRTGNLIGLRLWSDGKQITPMLRRPPAVVHCHQCQKCYWLADAKEIGAFDEWGADAPSCDPSWQTAPLVEEPDEMSYYAAMADGLATTQEHERHLRLLAWWRSNDPWRRDPNASRPHLSEASRQNLEALVRLFDKGDENSQLIQAEALRELGQFDRASSLLSQITSEQYAPVVSQLRSFCDAGDARVRELKLERQ